MRNERCLKEPILAQVCSRDAEIFKPSGYTHDVFHGTIVYLPIRTFTMKIQPHVAISIPYMDPMGYLIWICVVHFCCRLQSGETTEATAGS